jgi:hypothetical protein
MVNGTEHFINGKRNLSLRFIKLIMQIRYREDKMDNVLNEWPESL